MTSNQIRQAFKDFFESKNHKIVPSAPMVIKDDPTLMFTNAGMNQFKDVILGNVPIIYPRVADSQKCLRVSGKHNDLEEVGHDTYHHTMFEMLGNWSFGDYFKKEAISWAWEFLTEVLKLDKERFYATVFEGSKEENLNRDDEAACYWEAFLPKERILNGNKKDNFWEMGDTGPCGPCSEIHIDLRSDVERAKTDALTLINHDHPQVIEIWNLVFMQYDRKTDGSLVALPAKVIDTGMGFERLCMAVQKKSSNYDTDVFQTIIKKIAEISNGIYGKDIKKDIAMRVIADHVRTIAFSITDGQLPSNAKAGYVIRRILRRAVRYGYTFLGQHQSFIYKLIPSLIDVMGDAYPELTEQQALIEKVIKEEENSFLRTLATGIKLLDKEIENNKAKNSSRLNGTTAFHLYDTFGFPLDLTELILRENGMSVDTDGFKAEMQKQKERARNAASVEMSDWTIVCENDPEFVGYDQTECETKIVRYREVIQKKNRFFQLVLSKTPCYAEMGGQVGDTGWLIDQKGEKIEIYDTKRENNLPIHLTKKLPSELHTTFTVRIDTEKREATESNHSATHLMHEALREVLGQHVQQKGSYVSPDVLRFDFSHFQKMTQEEIRKVEMSVTEKIRKNYPLIENRHVPIDEAKAQGAMALFGEKYGDVVRTIRFGSSVELCGGTHTQSTGKIGTFRITSETAIAAGIRRIEAVTAKGCEDYLYSTEDTLRSIKELFAGSSQQLLETIRKQIVENEAMRKTIQEYAGKEAEQIKIDIINSKTTLNGVQLFKLEGKTLSPEMVKDIAFKIKGQFPEEMIFVATTHYSGRPSITVMLGKKLVDAGHNASNIVREAAKQIEGGGGGQPHFATAGGKKIEGLAAAMESVLNQLR